MTQVDVRSASAMLPQLVARARAGEEIVLLRGRRPVAKLVPLRGKTEGRRFGVLKGLMKIGPEFFEPVPEEELR